MAWFHLKGGFEQSNNLLIRAVTGLQGMLRDVGFLGPCDASYHMVAPYGAARSPVRWLARIPSDAWCWLPCAVSRLSHVAVPVVDRLLAWRRMQVTRTFTVPFFHTVCDCLTYVRSNHTVCTPFDSTCAVVV
jgi:hypothetical protein